MDRARNGKLAYSRNGISLGLLSENKIKMRRVLGDYRWVLVVIGTGQSTVEKLRKKNNVKSNMMQDMSRNARYDVHMRMRCFGRGAFETEGETMNMAQSW